MEVFWWKVAGPFQEWLGIGWDRGILWGWTDVEVPRTGTRPLDCLPGCPGCQHVTRVFFKVCWGKDRFCLHLGMDQYLLIPFLGGWTSIYQLFWCSPGVQGFDTLPFGFGSVFTPESGGPNSKNLQRLRLWPFQGPEMPPIWWFLKPWQTPSNHPRYRSMEKPMVLGYSKFWWNRPFAIVHFTASICFHRMLIINEW